jgi:hypothetical protein
VRVLRPSFSRSSFGLESMASPWERQHYTFPHEE